MKLYWVCPDCAYHEQYMFSYSEEPEYEKPCPACNIDDAQTAWEMVTPILVYIFLIGLAITILQLI